MFHYSGLDLNTKFFFREFIIQKYVIQMSVIQMARVQMFFIQMSVIRMVTLPCFGLFDFTFGLWNLMSKCFTFLLLNFNGSVMLFRLHSLE